MNQWGKTAAEEMLGLLRDKFGTDFSDIAAVKQYWHSVNVIFFSHLNHRLLYGNRPFCLAVFEHYGLVSEELVCLNGKTIRLFKACFVERRISAPAAQQK